MNMTTETTNHPHRNVHYYAAQSPRGFSNETEVHIFPSRKMRDAWVSEHEDDGDINSRSCGAYAVTSKRAHRILAYRGDDWGTESFNSSIQHPTELETIHAAGRELRALKMGKVHLLEGVAWLTLPTGQCLGIETLMAANGRFAEYLVVDEDGGPLKVGAMK